MDDEFDTRLKAGETTPRKYAVMKAGAEHGDAGEGVVQAKVRTDYVRIVLSHDQNIPPTGQFFGINGKGYMLKAGVAADVPRGIIDILNNAVYDEPETDPLTTQVIGYRTRLRFPYTLVGDGRSAVTG